MSTLETPRTESGAPPLPADGLIIVPVRNLVLFPGLIAPLTLGRAGVDARRAGGRAHAKADGPPPAAQRETEQPASTELYSVGTVATILRYVTTPDGAHNLVVQGDKRFRVAEFLEGRPYMAARAEMLPDPSPVNRDIEARMLQVKARAAELLELMPRAPAELVASIEQIHRQVDLPTSLRASSTSRPPRSRIFSKRSTCRCASTGCSRSWWAGSRC